MTPFLLYIGRSSLYLALFYAFFLLAMRRTTFFRLNRALLLLGTLVCFLLPILRVRTVMAPQIVLGPLTEVASEPALTAGPAASSPVPYLELLYAAGFLAVLAWAVVAYVRMRRTIRKGTEVPREDGTKLVLMDSDIPSFSWARTIVISRKDMETNPAMLLHERAHIQKGHTVDTLWFLGVVLIHWFNPLVWIALSELKLLHEYEADEAVLDKGIDATQYQLLLVRKAVGEKRFSLANGFQHANLKNRIDMMLKSPSSAWRRLAWLAILPFLAGTMFLVNPVRAKAMPMDLETPAVSPEITLEAQSAPDDTSKALPYNLIEVKPSFNGGSANEFAKWVNENLKYPKAAYEAGIQGRITLQFTIGKDGKVGDVKVLRGAHPDLDAEALRVVSSSPDWTPGYVKGEPVKVTFMFPVIFQLKDKNKDNASEAESAPQNATIQIRGAAADSVLFVLDGKEGVKMSEIDPNTIESMQVLKGEQAIAKYGEKGRNGVIEITSKKQD
jgi:TonB family protein